MKCEHVDYDDYFERCDDCGMSGEAIHASECVPAGFEVTEDGACSRCGMMLEEK